MYFSDHYNESKSIFVDKEKALQAVYDNQLLREMITSGNSLDEPFIKVKYRILINSFIN